jgi:hypothetical protein
MKLYIKGSTQPLKYNMWHTPLDVRFSHQELGYLLCDYLAEDGVSAYAEVNEVSFQPAFADSAGGSPDRLILKLSIGEHTEDEDGDEIIARADFQLSRSSVYVQHASPYMSDFFKGWVKEELEERYDELVDIVRDYVEGK